MKAQIEILEKVERDFRREYKKYHGKPEQIKIRYARLKARRELEKQGRVRKGDGKDVHHKDWNPKNVSQSNLRVVDSSSNRSFDRNADNSPDVRSMEAAYIEEGLGDMFNTAKKWAKKAQKALGKIPGGLKKEKDETKDMLNTYFRLLKAKVFKGNKVPTKAEIRAANAQLKDVAKVAAIAAIIAIPLGFDDFSIIGIELLARQFGCTFMPSALRGII